MSKWWSKVSRGKYRGVGLALSGGSVRGLAHVGVLKSLVKHQVPIVSVAGTSAGSIAGALFCAGVSIAELEQIVLDLDWTSAIRPNFTNLAGFFNSKNIEKFMDGHLPVKTIGQLTIPLTIVAADLISGNEVVFNSAGDSIPFATMASSNFPGIFTPIKYKHQLLVDGCIVNNLPVNHLPDNCYKVAVDVIPDVPFTPKTPDIISVLSRVNDLYNIQSRKSALHKAHLTINPVDKYISSFKQDKKSYKDLIKMGYEATEAKIREIKKHVKI